jgi:presenilin-like A22 family membrane protease
MAGAQEPAFKARPIQLLPIALGLVVTAALGAPLATHQAAAAQVTPFLGDNVQIASLNAIIFVIGLAASATVMFLFIRRGRMRFIRKLVQVALVIVSFAVVLWYTSSIFQLLGSPIADPLATILEIVVSVSAAGAIGILVFGKRKTGQLAGLTLVGPLTGIFLGYSIGLITAIVLVAALIIYDIFAVFRGPVGALAKRLEPDDLPGAMLTYGELSIGMGDLVFYSLVATVALVNLGWLPFLAAAIGILLGSYIGFKELAKHEMFPGLPFSLALGVGGMFLAYWLQLL